MTSSPKSKWRTEFCRTGERAFCGFVVDCSNPTRKFSVDILVDGVALQLLRADAPVKSLIDRGIGDGCYGFSCALHTAAINHGAVVEARLANLGTSVGVPIELSEPCGDASVSNRRRGSVRWLGGLRFAGSMPVDQATAIAKVLVDGALTAQVRAAKWTHIGTSEADARAEPAFDFHLPKRFADGNVHYVLLVDELGQKIGEGDPVAFLAYEDGIHETLAGHGLSEREGLRAKLLEDLLPSSLPFTDYQSWRDRFSVLSGVAAKFSCAIVMVGSGEAEVTLESLNEQTRGEWVAVSLPALDDPFSFPAEFVLKFLADEGADCDFVVFALAGTLFTPAALDRIAGAFAAFPEAEMLYPDVDVQSDDGSVWPLAFPAFDYERLLEQGYCAHVFALRRSTAEPMFKAEATTLYKLFYSVLDNHSGSSSIIHLPGATAVLPDFDKTSAALALAAATKEHLERMGVRAQITCRSTGVLPAIQITRTFDRVPITIIIPTRNRSQLLRSCLESIWPAVERMQAQVLVIDNDSSDHDTLKYLVEIERCGATVLRIPGEFNLPRLNNHAVKRARGEVLCLLNNDIKALDDRWIDEMLSRLAGPDVGAVGALLAWPSGVVQHAGVVLGPSFAAAYAFNDRVLGDLGYGDLLHVAHECSAVTAACLVTRRQDFLAVGGMDDVRFPVNFNDVDYCLKLRAKGKRIVFTPHARLIHLEAASCGNDARIDQEKRFERELQNLRAKWGPVLAADPYYNPMLSRDPIPFSALAWPPGSMQPRVNWPPVAVSVPSGF